MNRNLLGKLEGRTPIVKVDNGSKKQEKPILHRLLLSVVLLSLGVMNVASAADIVPFTVSTATNKYYYKIDIVVDDSGNNYVLNYYIAPTTPVSTSNLSSNDLIWYMMDAGGVDPWGNTSYYFINAVSGQYLYYTGTSTNSVVMKSISDPDAIPNRFKFKVRKTQNTTLYLINTFGGSFGISPLELYTANLSNLNGNPPDVTKNIFIIGTNQGGTNLKIGNANSWGNQWVFESIPIDPPTFSYDVNTQKVTIESTTQGVSIYYTRTGADPIVPTGGNNPVPPTYLYNPNDKPSVDSRTVVKAIAVKDAVFNSEMASTIIVTAPEIIVAGTYTYDSTEIEPDVSSIIVKDGPNITPEVIIDPSEYTVSFANNINVGTNSAQVIISDTDGNYIVNGIGYFTINPMSIGDGGAPVTGITVNVSLVGSDYVVTVKHGPKTLRESIDYTKVVDYDTDAVTITGIGNYTGSATVYYAYALGNYYALHCQSKGYLTRSSDNATLTTPVTFRCTNSFTNDGSSLWVLTSQGYLQSDYYYLNVTDNHKLYLSVTPVTQWTFEDVIGSTKKHVRTSDGYYLCNPNNTITLSTNPTNYYNACPITTYTENSWSGPTASALTVQSPQQVTYLRNCYFTQNVTYGFTNDNEQSITDMTDRRVFVTMTFKETSDANYGLLWDFDMTNGVIYHAQGYDNVKATATYNLLPADPIARALHPTAVATSVEFTLQPKPIMPDVNKNYLLYNIGGSNNNFRYPKDNNDISVNSPVSPNGKGGIGNDSDLTDPDTNPNLQISWKVEADAEGFYSFKNVSTGRYLYFDETAHASSDYGTLKVGATTLPTGDTHYKFRLFMNSNGDFGTCYYIIPFSKQFAVWKSDGVMSSNYVYAVLNVTHYSGQTTPVVSLYTTGNNSKWCIYKYEAEYRVKTDFTITGSSSTSSLGSYTFTSSGWYAKCIKESPETGNQQTSMVIKDSYYTALPDLDYMWSVEGLDSYSSNSGNGTSSFIISVEHLPVLTATGTIQLQLKGGPVPEGDYIYSDSKTAFFTINGNSTYTLDVIHSLAEIDDQFGTYQFAADANVAYSETNKPTVETFCGILDGNGLTVTNLTAPLFTTLSNGRVYNLNLKGVNISGHNGPTGAIAGTANGLARIYNCGILPTTTTYDANGNITGFIGSSIGSSNDYCGGLVGLLSGFARVINCFSYATITGGTTVGGLVGYNNFASLSDDLRTMVMNCMFYGNIVAAQCSDVSPVYGGLKITNIGPDRGLNNFDYFRYDAPYSTDRHITAYNCSLGAEDRFLTHFEFHRTLLNSNRELASWYVFGDVPSDARTKIRKWVLDKSIAPYPILKEQGTYPSVVNPDAASAVAIDENHEHYNEGRKLTDMGTNGLLAVHIQMGGGTPFTKPEGATIFKADTNLIITDKDPDNFNFNYGKVQLPYYNNVGTKNYTGNRVVTGWKIVSITGGTKGDYIQQDVFGGYNFADREHWAKDYYGNGGANRIFNQGAYWEVPDGVTAITIEPYWAKCVYLSDSHYDVTYKTDYGSATYVSSMGQRYDNGSNYDINGSSQKVYTTVDNARSALESDAARTPYDYAIVLVGNYHRYQGNTNSSITGNNYDNNNNGSGKPYTFMSADLDFDNEPDNVFYYQHGIVRTGVSPIRFDFIHLTGIGMAQKVDGTYPIPEPGTFWNYGWFEVTNTALLKLTGIEYVTNKQVDAPLILQGGIYSNVYSYQGAEAGSGSNIDPPRTPYIHIGGNAYFETFSNGSHLLNNQFTPHVPISVTGGEYNKFYLSGYTLPKDGAPTPGADDAECYIDGGRFGEMAGAAMWQVDGNVGWSIRNADIGSFFGGGINGVKPVTGNISTTIRNSRVDMFCGGPMFGDMSTNKMTITEATDCIFGTYYGAGFGGTSYYRFTATEDNHVGSTEFDGWSDWVSLHYKRKYDGSKGISTNYDLIFFQYSGGKTPLQNVAQIYVNYASFSLATTRSVTSTLTRCIVNKNFYGGGNLGKVDGNVESTLTDCTVRGSAFGAGFSATVPTLFVYPTGDYYEAPYLDGEAGVFVKAKYPTGEEFKWEQAVQVSTNNEFNEDKHLIYTTENLKTLGTVTGNVTLTIQGNSTVYENVYGGGDESKVNSNTLVKVLDQTKVFGNIYGGGNLGKVDGNTEVIINGTMPQPQP